MRQSSRHPKYRAAASPSIPRRCCISPAECTLASRVFIRSGGAPSSGKAGCENSGSWRRRSPGRFKRFRPPERRLASPDLSNRILVRNKTTHVLSIPREVVHCDPCFPTSREKRSGNRYISEHIDRAHLPHRERTHGICSPAGVTTILPPLTPMRLPCAIHRSPHRQTALPPLSHHGTSPHYRSLLLQSDLSQDLGLIRHTVSNHATLLTFPRILTKRRDPVNPHCPDIRNRIHDHLPEPPGDRDWMSFIRP